MTSPAAFFIADIFERVIDQADRLLFGIQRGQSDTVVSIVEPNGFMLEMAGLAVNPQVRGMGGAFSMNRVTVAALPTNIGSMRRTGHVGMTMDAGHVLVWIALERIGDHLQRHFLAVNHTAAIGVGVALAAEGSGGLHAFIGINIGLPVAIQADRFRGMGGKFLGGRQRVHINNQENGDSGRDYESYAILVSHLS